ncbi:LIC_13387 family protein [Usitatibacter palustris]|uniref:Uncharacterized protein n=1 Tax=Usitatibacter palustris TaxID=2732487 RepID=A0A6M4H761_9PROT|nr:hypothetical protein [Usitatibacter palustris]QJR15370.1 hypothetical protein DSM104440_02189 [Usitatibacter palustris]
MPIKTVLVGASAFIPLVLGSLHLLYTYWGPKLLPRDPAVVDAMKATTMVITRETTVWNAWIGFNATHSMSLILFGLVYGYLAVARPDVLLGSAFLQGVGLVTLVAFAVLSKNNFFSVPLAGISIALALYALGLVAGHQQ